eukprot:PhM_4_TR17912/c0_g1_i1/m.10907/K07962/ARL13B, ARL2L1; ADP-ribosylation factor-like protein 13B
MTSSTPSGGALKVTISMFGLDNAGKTSLVHAIGGQPTMDTTPTMGFAPHTFMGGRFELSVYDLGGAARFRGIWRNYYSDIHGIVFVVDAADRERFEEAQEVIAGILADPRAADKPLLIVANKQDQEGAATEEDVLAALKLSESANVHAVSCVAVKDPMDERIDAGMEWMLESVASQYQSLSTRIRQQTAEDKAAADKHKREQRQRVQQAKRVDYIHANNVHYFFEQLAGRILIDMPKDAQGFLRRELERMAKGVHKVNVAVFGLDNAGKTSLVSAIGGQPTTETTPTVGFVPHTMKNKSYEVVVFDLGGASNFRGIWHNYYADVHGVLFVLDSSDAERFPEAREVLSTMLKDTRIAGKPLLIVANKQDKEGAVTGTDNILASIGVPTPVPSTTKVIECVSVQSPSDSRIDEGMEWILESVASQYQQLSVRIVQHLAEEKAKRRQRLEEQRLRVLNANAAEAAGLDPNNAAAVASVAVSNPPLKTNEERMVEYVKESGVHYLLERLAGCVLEAQPENMVEFLAEEIAKDIS